VLTAAYAGCRWGELVGLRRKNIDLSVGTLAVVEQVVELRGGQLLTREPKSLSDDVSYISRPASSSSSRLTSHSS